MFKNIKNFSKERKKIQKIGVNSLYIGIFLLPTAPAISVFFFLISLLFSENNNGWPTLLIGITAIAFGIYGTKVPEKSYENVDLIANQSSVNLDKQDSPFLLKSTKIRKLLLAYLLCTGVLSLIILPSSFTAVAAKFVAYDHHPVSFVIAPALYFWSKIKLVPGLDYLPQYGIGTGQVFSWFLSNNIQ